MASGLWKIEWWGAGVVTMSGARSKWFPCGICVSQRWTGVCRSYQTERPLRHLLATCIFSTSWPLNRRRIKWLWCGFSSRCMPSVSRGLSEMTAEMLSVSERSAVAILPDSFVQRDVRNFWFSFNSQTYTLWVKKKQGTTILSITLPNVDRFSNFFTVRYNSKYATKSSLTIPPHLKGVAELPCETSIWENSENLMHALLSTTNHKVV